MRLIDRVFLGYFLFIIVLISGYIFLIDESFDPGGWWGGKNMINLSFDDTDSVELPYDPFVSEPKSGDLKGSLDNTGGDLQDRKGGSGEFTEEVYMPSRQGIVTADDQDAFLAMGLTPADTVGKDHGYPVEGLMGGGYIPLPYSSIDGITTNEDLAINI
jgi:hypothetical protein